MNQTLDVVQAPAVPVPATGSRMADYMALTKPGITMMVSLTAAAGFFLLRRDFRLPLRWPPLSSG